MLHTTASMSSDAAKAYFKGPDFDYLAEGQEMVGQWRGKGAAALGLAGQVDKPHFDQLCDNLDPRTGEQLTPKTRLGRRVGFDLTWSAPKSVSIVHALTGDDRIMDAFRETIHETMDEMEAEMHTRVRKGGQEYDRQTGNWAYAEFVHLTSRPVNGVPCPQLHVHNFVFNATHDPVEDQWKAGQFGNIKQSGFYWQAVQQARFARRLQELGYGVRRTKDAFEIAGVPQTAIEKFSLRRAVIEAAAERIGIKSPEGWAELGRRTREAKNDSIPYSQLVEIWKGRLSPDEDSTIKEVADRIRFEPGRIRLRDKDHVAFAVDHTFERVSVADERRLLALALRHGCGEVTPEGVRQEMDRLGLLKRKDEKQTLVTTKEVLKEEAAMIRFAVAGRGTMRPVRFQGGGKADPVTLSVEQQALRDHVMKSPDKVILLVGDAGTGKSTAAVATVPLLESAGKGVVMVAPSTRASREELRAKGFDDADTLARLFIDKAMQEKARNGFIWVDEAGMVGTRTMARLFELADSLGARVVLMGDKKQMKSVEAGSPMRVLEEVAKLPVARLTEIRRQENAKDRQAVALIAMGKHTEGFDALDKNKRIHEDGTVEAAHEAAAKDYVAAVRAGQSAMVIVPTHREGQMVAERIREGLRANGELDEEEKVFDRLIPAQFSEAQKEDWDGYRGEEILQFTRRSGEYRPGDKLGIGLVRGKRPSAKLFNVYLPGQGKLSKGDVIQFTANIRNTQGKDLHNGSFATVKGFTKDGDIELKDKGIIRKDVMHWKSGYYSTGHGTQGPSYDVSIPVATSISTPAIKDDWWYVAVSRTKKKLAVHTDSKEELRELVQRHEPRMSATELVGQPKKSWLRRWQERICRLKERAMVAAKAHVLENTRGREAYGRTG